MRLASIVRAVGEMAAVINEDAKLKDCGRFEWNVLDWNESAIQFYESVGGLPFGR